MTTIIKPTSDETDAVSRLREEMLQVLTDAALREYGRRHQHALTVSEHVEWTDHLAVRSRDAAHVLYTLAENCLISNIHQLRDEETLNRARQILIAMVCRGTTDIRSELAAGDRQREYDRSVVLYERGQHEYIEYAVRELESSNSVSHAEPVTVDPETAIAKIARVLWESDLSYDSGVGYDQLPVMDRRSYEKQARAVWELQNNA